MPLFLESFRCILAQASGPSPLLEEKDVMPATWLHVASSPRR